MIRVIGAIVAVLLATAGAVALVFYVQGADQRAAAGARFEDVYLVTEQVPKGTPGEDVKNFIEVGQLPELAVQPGVVTDLDELAGLVSTADLLPGEQLIAARFSDPQELAAGGEVVLPEGTQEVTVALEVERVAGGVVVPGSTVGVVITSNTDSHLQTSQPPTTDTQFAFHKMLVTRVTPGQGFTTGEADASTSETVGTIMVTFAATTPQVERLVFAAEQQKDGAGGIWLTLEPETADETGSARRTGENIFQ
ncbi:Flp pilus assembly protein CpaB [Agromyces sp. NPDC056379]|uniref:Flp pilus assembly protein CpaB n=1 Tax=unclassified Agromyces TaxID=2639701 RepID=UPI0035DE2F0A